MNVRIRFKDGAELTAERNGDCYITDTKPNFPDDLSVVWINNGAYETVIKNAEIAECAAVDGRYWFAFIETPAEVLRQRELEDTIQMLTDCLLEMSELIYS